MYKSTSHPSANDTISVLINRSEQRKKELRKNLTTNNESFKGASGRKYTGIIDAYHGETGLALDKDAEEALQKAWNEILHKMMPADYSNDMLYDKRQPLILRQLAAEKLFARLSQPSFDVQGIKVPSDEVIVCPYSSMMMVEEALATIARSEGVIVCPEGFYKNFGLFTKNLACVLSSVGIRQTTHSKLTHRSLPNACNMRKRRVNSVVCFSRYPVIQ